MSKLLVELLGIPERDFRRYIDRLENVCLNPGVDIRLGAEIQSKTRLKAGQLGLDVQDTTPKEYYYALKGRLFDDDKQLKEILKLKPKDPELTAKKMAKTATKLSKNEYCLAVTTSGLKRILIAVPPRKTMRLLKLRSVESFIKRYDPRLVFALANVIEDQSWSTQVHAKISRLAVKDISWQPVEAIAMPQQMYQKIQEKMLHHGTHIVSHDAGVICVLPVLNDLGSGVATLCLGLLLHAIQRVASDSMVFRYTGLARDYNTALLEVSTHTHSSLATIHGLLPSWHTVHELLSSGHSLPNFEPDLIVGELEWQSIEMKFAALDSRYDFWVGSHYFGLKTGEKPVSLHLLDVARSVASDLQYDERPSLHCCGSVWNELQMRYMKQDALSRALANQLHAARESVLL
jgi:hypothetical protein